MSSRRSPTRSILGNQLPARCDTEWRIVFVIGAERARALRALDGIGWHSTVSDYGGCEHDE